MPQHETAIEVQGTLVNAGAADAIEQARALHRLATADPDRDGTLTSVGHEQRYDLERADASAQASEAAGVDPLTNRALPSDGS